MPRFFLKNAHTTLDFEYETLTELKRKLTEAGLPETSIDFLLKVSQ